ncbi:sensor histidine kinase [Haloplanus rubicundus]|uniref:histidine kinase n=1 Tax=Haloplanus rubicundus TaxID=1547898 RepID=A0A345EFA6_9EURY|nr:HAMP domain-containing sensor histidine kinase [Haloplanus rubicundus]AXG07463.1 sensor histidine kinase [Haloplanus rubicundus]AXG10878.1 sensor histidine kinase [Haloplanus rubicundus]
MPEPCRTLQNALNALDDVFYVYDERGRLIFWNTRLNELFALDDERIAEMRPVDFFVDADRPAVEAAVQRIFDEGETVVEAWADTTEGRIRFELTGRKLTDDGHTIGFCGVGRDVTDRRERERQVAAQNDRLTQFATILVHDLRNPLAVATGYLDRYQADGEPADIERVTDSLERIERIVDDVLTVAMEGQAVIDARPVSVGDTARSAWEMIDASDASLDVQTTLVVDGDESRLQRLFENLFRNSVEHGSTDDRHKSGDEGGEHAGPSIAVTETGAGFAVADDGPGIPAAERERVFDPGVTQSEDGTGFGLYIVRTIAEAHGWTVGVTEGERGGARFEFTTTPVGMPGDGGP